MTTDDYIIDQAEQVTRLKKQVEQLRVALKSLLQVSDFISENVPGAGWRVAQSKAREALAATEPEVKP